MSPNSWQFAYSADDPFLKHLFKGKKVKNLAGSDFRINADVIVEFVDMYVKTWDTYFKNTTKKKKVSENFKPPTSLSILKRFFGGNNHDILIRTMLFECFSVESTQSDEHLHLQALDEDEDDLLSRHNTAFQHQHAVRVLFGYKTLLTACFHLNKLTVYTKVIRLKSKLNREIFDAAPKSSGAFIPPKAKLQQYYSRIFIRYPVVKVEKRTRKSTFGHLEFLLDGRNTFPEVLSKVTFNITRKPHQDEKTEKDEIHAMDDMSASTSDSFPSGCFNLGQKRVTAENIILKFPSYLEDFGRNNTVVSLLKQVIIDHYATYRLKNPLFKQSKPKSPNLIVTDIIPLPLTEKNLNSAIDLVNTALRSRRLPVLLVCRVTNWKDKDPGPNLEIVHEISGHDLVHGCESHNMEILNRGIFHDAHFSNHLLTLGEKIQATLRSKVKSEHSVVKSDNISTSELDLKTGSPPSHTQRVDLRDLLVFSIDPPTTKDIDDVLSVEFLENGTFRLGIHISDISFVVTPNSEIDKEANRRGTSTYLPHKVIPMLPIELSQDVCSFTPNQDRFAFSTFCILDKNGQLCTEQPNDGIEECAWFGKTTIRNNFKLDYSMALDFIKIAQLRVKNGLVDGVSVDSLIERKLATTLPCADHLIFDPISVMEKVHGLHDNVSILLQLEDMPNFSEFLVKYEYDLQNEKHVEKICHLVRSVRVLHSLTMCRRSTRFASGSVQLNKVRVQPLKVDQNPLLPKLDTNSQLQHHALRSAPISETTAKQSFFEIFGQGQTQSISVKCTFDTNILVEECMLLVNTLVASRVHRVFPKKSLMRSHDSPKNTRNNANTFISLLNPEDDGEFSSVSLNSRQRMIQDAEIFFKKQYSLYSGKFQEHAQLLRLAKREYSEQLSSLFDIAYKIYQFEADLLKEIDGTKTLTLKSNTIMTASGVVFSTLKAQTASICGSVITRELCLAVAKHPSLSLSHNIPRYSFDNYQQELTPSQEESTWKKDKDKIILLHQMLANYVVSKSPTVTVFHLIENLTVFSFNLAKYVKYPSGFNPDTVIHFGLNAKYYTHFSAPIRRYFDIIIHRMLDASLLIQPIPNTHLATPGVLYQSNCIVQSSSAANSLEYIEKISPSGFSKLAGEITVLCEQSKYAGEDEKIRSVVKLVIQRTLEKNTALRYLATETLFKEENDNPERKNNTETSEEILAKHDITAQAHACISSLPVFNTKNELLWSEKNEFFTALIQQTREKVHQVNPKMLLQLTRFPMLHEEGIILHFRTSNSDEFGNKYSLTYKDFVLLVYIPRLDLMVPISDHLFHDYTVYHPQNVAEQNGRSTLQGKVSPYGSFIEIVWKRDAMSLANFQMEENAKVSSYSSGCIAAAIPVLKPMEFLPSKPVQEDENVRAVCNKMKMDAKTPNHFNTEQKEYLSAPSTFNDSDDSDDSKNRERFHVFQRVNLLGQGVFPEMIFNWVLVPHSVREAQ